MKFNFEGSATELRMLLGGIMVPIEIEDEEEQEEIHEEETQPLPDPWGLVEPAIMKFIESAPDQRAGLAQYMFEAREHSPYVRAFRELDGIYHAVNMSLPSEISEEIQASFRVPGIEKVGAKEIAGCLIQLGSLYGMPEDLRPLPQLHEVDASAVSHG